MKDVSANSSGEATKGENINSVILSIIFVFTKKKMVSFQAVHNFSTEIYNPFEA